MVLEGHVLRGTRYRAGIAAEIFGPGDVCPFQDETATSTTSVALLALGDCSLMMLDGGWLRAAHHTPEVAEALVTRSIQAAARASRQSAVRSGAAVDQRLLTTLGYLAERWGRRDTEGTAVDVPGLTHDVLATLTGSRRATVTGAMGRLADRGLIKRSVDRRWILLVPDAEPATLVPTG